MTIQGIFLTMNKKLAGIPFQKYFPYVLLAITVIAGLFILFKKKIISLPSSDKSTVAEVKETSIIDIIFSGKEHKLSYESVDPTNFINISKFDKDDQWQGDGSIEGETKSENFLNIIDRNRSKTAAYLSKNLNLSTIDKIKLAVNLKSDPDDLESLNIYFGDKDLTRYYRFSVTNLIAGVNYLSIPKYRFFLVDEITEGQTKKSTITPTEKSIFGWDKVEKIQLELLSRPSSKANIEVSWIRGEKDDLFTSDWNWDGNEQFFNLETAPGGKTVLLVNNVGNRPVATLRKVGSVKDFTYSVKITAIKKGAMGLFFRGDYKTGYGYYLTIGGLGNNDWTLYKSSVIDKKPTATTLINGQIANFEFNKDQPFWLKVVTKGSNIIAYFSLDGNDFTKLAEVTDNDLGAGGVGIILNTGGTGYFDEFVINQ